MVACPVPITWGGKLIEFGEHRSDKIRLEALLEYGGMYFDFDVLTMRSLDPLRVYPMVMGHELSNGTKLCNGNMLAERNAVFLRDWYAHYLSHYDPKCWECDSVSHPAMAARGQPESVIHTEWDTMNRPNWTPFELEYLYGSKTYDYSKNYNVHLWYRSHGIEYTPKTLNMTIPVCHLFSKVIEEAKSLFDLEDLEESVDTMDKKSPSLRGGFRLSRLWMF
jgi:mannosyltransferase OCH1-like enzyme